MDISEKYLYKPNNCSNDFVVWMGFPERYSFSMSSLGFLWLFKRLDEDSEITTERICYDTKKTLYNPTDISAFGFSFSFDYDFLRIFSMLEKYNIPLKSKDRENLPFIFAGGPVVTANPEPYRDIFDFFIIGDGEEVNINALKIIKNNKDKQKNEILKILSRIDGIYVPNPPPNPLKKGEGKYFVVKHTKKLTECIYTPILSEDAYFKNTFIIEITRGCANRCAFCLASYLNLPLRSVPEDELFKAIDLGLKHTNKIAFLGAQVSAHPKFNEVCKYIYDRIQQGENIEMNFSSLRVDAITPDVIKTLKAAGQKNITLAIEAGNERLRKFINKNLSDEQIFNAVEIIKNNGLKGIKFYGMIGIPTETDSDIKDIISLAKNIKNKFKGLDISFGFSTFVPKANTPFQWYGREKTKSLEKKTLFLEKELRKIGVQVSISSAKWDYWQAVLSRGDDTLGDFLIETYKNGGKIGAFKAAAKKFGINTDYFALENYDFEKELPWDFIDVKPGKDFLVKENNRLSTSACNRNT